MGGFLLEVGTPSPTDKISPTPMRITDYYVASDAMGSVTTILDEDGNILERRSYDAFGEMACMSPDGTPVATSPTGVDVGFQGQVREEITGLYQMGYRWCSPDLGRWLSRDPIGLDGGVNWSAFLLNNPMSTSDQFGLQASVPFSAWSTIPMAPEGNQTIGEIHSRPIEPVRPIASTCLTYVALGYMDHFFLVLDDGSRFANGGGTYNKEGDKVIPLRIPNNIDAKMFKECIKLNWPTIDRYDTFSNNCRQALVETIKKCLKKLGPSKPHEKPCPLVGDAKRR